MGFFHFLNTQLTTVFQVNLSVISNYMDGKVRIFSSILQFCKLCFLEPVKCSSVVTHESFDKKQEKAVYVYDKPKHKKTSREPKEWRCIDNCFWIIGCLCITWWLLLFLCNFLPAILPGFKLAELPGSRLKNEGLNAHHPVVLVPGIVTGGLELWEGKPCSKGLFRKRLWGGSFAELFKRFVFVDPVNFTYDH